jgi:hypothetical protein
MANGEPCRCERFRESQGPAPKIGRLCACGHAWKDHLASVDAKFPARPILGQCSGRKTGRRCRCLRFRLPGDLL